MSTQTPSDPTTPSRASLRQQLLARREAWSGSPEHLAAQQALQSRLMTVLGQLEPECLGLYWPIRGEFNPREVAMLAQQAFGCTLALPWAQKSPRQMDYRTWQGDEPASRDDCGIPAPDSKPCTPDVVVVPCVGYTREGFRLGYGGGYFDRYLAQHPGVTALGVAWAHAELTLTELAPEAHDLPLIGIVTDTEVWSD
ncbi:5-formyltetrahydrofolate cyclo-ligase [Aquabacterium sp.]|uniref:5-formyltetrahydrofolate cyclo-ligase n=1 Tax=Aquabacterium sp. TaxID=1872578 RepID=UPI0035B0B85C